MRLALVITELEVGGAEQALVNLAVTLHGTRRGYDSSEGDGLLSSDRIGSDLSRDDGRDSPANLERVWQVSVFVLAARPAPGSDRLVDQLQRHGVAVTFLDLRRPRRFALLGAACQAVHRLTNQFRDLRPDVVQTFLFHANLVGTLAAWRAGVPCRVLGFRVADPRSSRLALERMVLHLACRAVCVSEGVRQHALNQGRMPPEKLVVISNGLAERAFQSPADDPAARSCLRRDRRALWGVSDEAFVLLGIGRLDRQKGFDDLIDRFAAIVGPDDDWHLVLVGDGAERPALSRQAAALGLTDRVHLPGRSKDVRVDLMAADVFILSSRYEGMANVLLEAMAAGRPVLVRAVEGVAEWSKTIGTDQLVDPFDGPTLATQIQRLRTNPDLRSHLGATNRQAVMSQGTADVMADRYARLYLELAPSRSTPTSH